MRPDFITNEDIARWSENIDNDSKIPSFLKNSAVVREVMLSGLWFAEQLDSLGCPRDRISQLQFTAGRYCFGRDPWQAHQEFLDFYKNNQIEWEEDASRTD